jgi:hypothetical protein
MANAAFIPAPQRCQSIHASRGVMIPHCSPLAGRISLVARDPIPLSIVLLTIILFGMISLVPTQLSVSVAAHAQSIDPTVTSDSPEYCDVLMNRISGLSHAAAMPPPTEAATLSEEGERMCVHGQIRGGILRLRRALVLMRHGED